MGKTRKIAIFCRISTVTQGTDHRRGWNVSEKKLSAAQFEMLGIFCGHISKEISMLYDIGEFLSLNNR
jgi:hypothetical protein